MAVSERAARPQAARISLDALTRYRSAILLCLAVAAGTTLLRVPSFFEPPWHTDEGIFSAVAERVLHGGRLYADAWESKPPLFIYIYVGLIKLFGAGVLPLRVAATASAIGTELALYGVARTMMSRRAALWATALLAFLIGVPFWEGNLALADTFTILPSTLGVLCALRAISHDAENECQESSILLLLLAGSFFGLAFLIRQTAAVVPFGIVVWWLVSGRPWFRPGAVMAIGSALIVVPVVAGYALFGSFHWFWNANVGFFFRYIPSGEQISIYERPLIVLPVFVAIGALIVMRRRGEIPRWGLPALWLTLTLATAMLTGRPYPHYFLTVFPPLALIVVVLAQNARFSWRPSRPQAPGIAIAGAVVLLWLAVVTPEFGNPYAFRYSKVENYYPNFAKWAVGAKSTEAYKTYFDERVPLTERIGATLDRLGAANNEVYIWGEHPWAYALSDSVPTTAYTTSFYVLLIRDLDTELWNTLLASDPRFVVMLSDAWPRHRDDTGVMATRYLRATKALNSLIALRYEEVAHVGRARIFERVPPRPYVDSN